MFGWLKKKVEPVIKFEDPEKVEEPEEQFAPIFYQQYPSITLGHVEGINDKPELPDWYGSKWELVIRGGSYAIKMDGLFIADSSHSHPIFANFGNEYNARGIMYALIARDIILKDMQRREGEVVETWP